VDPHGRSTVLDLPEAAKALITPGGPGASRDGDGVDLDEEPWARPATTWIVMAGGGSAGVPV
jgi:hypothetical protein